MSKKTTSVLIALLLFGSASWVFAGSNFRNEHYGSVAPRRAVSVAMSSDRTEAANRAVKPVTAEERAWLGLARPTTACPRTECPALSPWHHRQHDGLDQIDHTRRRIDLHQLGTGNLDQI